MRWLTGAILFLVYLNAPVVAVRMHGAPFLLAAAIPLGLAIPVAYRVLVRGEPLRLPTALLAAMVMLLLYAVSALVSVRPYDSMDSLGEWLLEGVLLALLIANAVRSRAEIQMAAIALIGAGAVMGVIAIAQQALGATDHNFFGFGQLDAVISDAEGRLQRRLAGPIGETNRFAQIMAVLIPIAAGCALTSKGWTRLAYWAATLAICGGMVLAFSRGAIVALVLAVPFALAFRMLRVRHLVASLVAAVCMLAALPHYAERVFSIGEVAMQSLGVGGVGLRHADGAARGRLTEMKAAGLLFMDHPVLGAGPGLAPHYYEEYAGVVGGKVRTGTRRSHNLFLQLAAETGLIGLLAFGLVVALVFRELDRARRRLEISDRPLWGIVCGLELALVVSLTTSLFLHAAYIRYFWVLIGVSIAASVRQRPPVLVTLLARMFRETAARIRADA